MNTETVIPGAGPIPLPAPHWVFEILLLVTFTLHLCALNAAIGGALIGVVARLTGKSGGEPGSLAASLAKMIPSFVAAAVSLGVAALLFVQVLYGQALYTSSIVIAWPWFFVLLLIVGGYYGFYFVSYRSGSSPRLVLGVLTASVVLFGLAAYLFTGNLVLSTEPAEWAPRYHADPSGWNLYLDDITLLPRFVHFVAASVAVGGLVVLLLGLSRWKADVVAARGLVSSGARWFGAATMAQFGVGIWFLLALPDDQVRLFMGGDPMATHSLILGVVAGGAAIFAAARVRRAADSGRETDSAHEADSGRVTAPRRAAWTAVALTAVAILAMVMARAALRKAALAPWIAPAEFRVETQTGPMVVFFVLFLLGVVLWVRMVRLFFRSASSSS